MQIVYRLEHKTLKFSGNQVGLSPYSEELKPEGKAFRRLYEILHEQHGYKDNHRPTPKDDGLDDIFNKEFLCASPSLDTLKEWFDCIYVDILKLGFVVRRYRVEQSYNSDSGLQCIFHKDEIISKRIIKKHV